MYVTHSLIYFGIPKKIQQMLYEHDHSNAMTIYEFHSVINWYSTTLLILDRDLHYNDMPLTNLVKSLGLRKIM